MEALWLGNGSTLGEGVTMPSPFPGMDPYLEDAELWPEFQQRFVTCLLQVLLPALTERYVARTSERRYYACGGAELHEPYIEIKQRDSGRLTTLIDVVSIANKTTAAGRTAYLETRQQAMAGGVSMVEIDLVLQG